jgi:hypothetical protein
LIINNFSPNRCTFEEGRGDQDRRAEEGIQGIELGLTFKEQSKNISETLPFPLRHGPTEFCMSHPAPTTDHDHYEQACNQAIAMCGGDLRSTIKALIMANEYLEIEMQHRQHAMTAGKRPRASSAAA